jgi:hypothetical protein
MTDLTTRPMIGTSPHESPSVQSIVTTFSQIVVGIVFTVVTYGASLATFREFGAGPGTFVSVVLVIMITLLLLQMHLSAYLFYWLSLVLLQNAVVGLWLPDHFSGDVPLVVTEAKTISLLVGVVVSLPLIFRLLQGQKSASWLMALYFAWVALSVRHPDTATFAYGRNFIFPLFLLLVVAARSQDFTVESRLTLLRRLLAYTIAVTSIGVVAEMAVGTRDWRLLLSTEKLGSLGGVSDTTRFFGILIDRTAGFIVEPTNAGYIAAICAVLLILLAVASKDHRLSVTWWVQFGAAVLLLIQSGARSGLLMLALSLVVIALSRFRLRPARLFIAGCLSAFVIVLVYVSLVKSPASVIKAFSDPPSLVGGDSTTFHLAGLMAGIQGGVRTIIGHGLGVGGNFSSIGGAESALTGAEKVATGGESAWGVLSYQTGIVGLVLLIAVLIVFGRNWGSLTLVALIIWSVTAMFAEASFGLQVSAMIMTGSALLRGAGATYSSGRNTLSLPDHMTGPNSSVRSNQSSTQS